VSDTNQRQKEHPAVLSLTQRDQIADRGCEVSNQTGIRHQKILEIAEVIDTVGNISSQAGIVTQVQLFQTSANTDVSGEVSEIVVGQVYNAKTTHIPPLLPVQVTSQSNSW
jgi:translation elongation factor EF-Tu-like GTPase